MKSINQYIQHLYAAQITGFRPLRIPTHMSFRERISLFRTAALLPEGYSIVEIGSWLGASITIMAAATKNPSAPLVCVDTWMNETMGEDPTNEASDVKNPFLGEKLSTFEEFEQNTAHLAGRLTKIRRDSAMLKASDLPDKIGIYFIDGDHSYEACKRDLDLALSVANVNTRILCHDFGIHRGVTDAICEYHAGRKVILHKLVDSLAHLSVHP